MYIIYTGMLYYACGSLLLKAHLRLEKIQYYI